MKFRNIRWVDVAHQDYNTGYRVSDVMPRDTAVNGAKIGRWWVPWSPIMGVELKWTLTKTGDVVMIPIHAYCIREASTAKLWALGLQLGLMAAEKFLSEKKEVIYDVQLSVGKSIPKSDKYDDAWSCFVGIALLV